MRPSAVLVFRDGRRQEIQSYAIAGTTLWIFGETEAVRIPLSSLDLEAMAKENLGRGIRSFPHQ